MALAIRDRALPSTTQIAREAGVAEGTIFNVFETKEALLEEALATAFCPAAFLERVARIDPDQSLRSRLVHLVELMAERFRSAFAYLEAYGRSGPPDVWDHSECIAAGEHQPGRSRIASPDNTAVTRAMAEVFRQDAAQLRVTPAELVAYSRLLTFSGSHPGITDGKVLSPQEIVNVVLDGTLKGPAR